MCLNSSVTRFGEIVSLWQNVNNVWDNLIMVLVWYLANLCTYFANFYATVQIFNDVSGLRLKNNITI